MPDKVVLEAAALRRLPFRARYRRAAFYQVAWYRGHTAVYGHAKDADFCERLYLARVGVTLKWPAWILGRVLDVKSVPSFPLKSSAYVAHISTALFYEVAGARLSLSFSREECGSMGSRSLWPYHAHSHKNTGREKKGNISAIKSPTYSTFS